MTFETTRTAALAAVDCMVSAGMHAEYQEEKSLNGVVTPSYRAYLDPELTDEENSAKMDVCEVREFHWINYVYQAQPSVQAINREYVEGRTGPLRACLESAGIEPDSGAGFDELANAALDLIHQGGKDCLAESGIESF